MSRDLICNHHDTIINAADDAATKLRDIMNRISMLDSDDKALMDELDSIFTDIEEVVDGELRDIDYHGDKALSAGQAMESRLMDYKNSIELLGFERSR